MSHAHAYPLLVRSRGGGDVFLCPHPHPSLMNEDGG
jgi:hypothetical protein